MKDWYFSVSCRFSNFEDLWNKIKSVLFSLRSTRANTEKIVVGQSGQSALTVQSKGKECMKLTLIRRYLKPTYIIGDLYLDGIHICNTLEDRYRDLMVEPKVPGATAIPYGTYKIILTHSQRFDRLLPLLLDVPQFDAIRIHGGNTDKDTSGCILVGKNDRVGQLSLSRVYLNLLMANLQNADDISIDILRV